MVPSTTQEYHYQFTDTHIRPPSPQQQPIRTDGAVIQFGDGESPRD